MHPSTEASIEAMARAQAHVLAPAQLIAAGLSESTIGSRCGPGGKWQRPLPRVVVLHNGPLSWEQRYWAAVLYGAASGRAAVTGRAALAFHGLRAVPAPEQVPCVDVLVPRSSHMRSRRADWPQGAVRVLRTRRMPDRVRMGDGPPVVPLLRAVADAARHARGGGGWEEAALYEVVQARGVEPALLAAELRSERLTGRAWIAEVLEALTAGLRSPAETRAREVLVHAGLPTPLWNVRLYLSGQWLADPDAYWPRHGVLFEVDSAAHHMSRDDWERTMARHNRIEAAGLKVLHASPRQLRRDPQAVTTALRQALESGPHGPWDQVVVRPPR